MVEGLASRRAAAAAEKRRQTIMGAYTQATTGGVLGPTTQGPQPSPEQIQANKTKGRTELFGYGIQIPKEEEVEDVQGLVTAWGMQEGDPVLTSLREVGNDIGFDKTFQFLSKTRPNPQLRPEVVDVLKKAGKLPAEVTVEKLKALADLQTAGLLTSKQVSASLGMGEGDEEDPIWRETLEMINRGAKMEDLDSEHRWSVISRIPSEKGRDDLFNLQGDPDGWGLYDRGVKMINSKKSMLGLRALINWDDNLLKWRIGELNDPLDSNMKQFLDKYFDKNTGEVSPDAVKAAAEEIKGILKDIFNDENLSTTEQEILDMMNKMRTEDRMLFINDSRRAQKLLEESYSKRSVYDMMQLYKKQFGIDFVDPSMIR